MGTLPTNSPAATNSGLDMGGSSEPLAPRRDIQMEWFQACNPPRMAGKESNESDIRSNVASAENSSLHKTGQMDNFFDAKGSSLLGSEVDPTNSSCNITEEGKRQVSCT